jgi:hypothetical protein
MDKSIFGVQAMPAYSDKRVQLSEKSQGVLYL